VGFQIVDINGEHLIPAIVARNVGASPTTIITRVPYTRADGTKSTISLPQKRLSAGEIGLIDTREIIAHVQQEQIQVASLEVEYNTSPGSVIVAAHSASTDGNQVFRVPMWDPLGQRSPTGGYPWRIEGTSVTETYIKNITDEEQDYVAFLLWENGGEYMIGLKPIGPHETVNIDVKKLRDEQIPDERGRTIPLNISKGQLQWTLRRKDSLADDDARANLSLIGRSEQVDVEKGIVNNYSCQNCCAGTHAYGYITPSSAEIEYGDTAHFIAVEAEETCYGFPYEYSIGANWTTSDSSLGTISGGNITAAGVGQTSIGASWWTHTGFSDPCPPGGEDPLLLAALDQTQGKTCRNGENRRGGPHLFEEGGSSTVPAALLRPPCGECQYRGFTFTAPSATLTEKPKVQKIQYKEPGTSNYVDITGTLFVLKGTTVEFKAIPSPSNASFPTGQPVWSGTSGATGTGQLKSVTFDTISSSTTNYKTVIATVASSITVNVLVYDLYPVLTPEDSFDPNRSTIKYGLREVVDLSFASNPTTTDTQVGGLTWTISSGTGTVDTQNNGTGTFTAPAVAESSTLKLEVLNGPSKSQYITKDITIVAPSGARMIRTGNIKHTQGVWGGGFRAYIHFDPTDVSFKNIRFREGTCLATADGYLASFDRELHPATSESIAIGNCNLVTGCRTVTYDEVYFPQPQPGTPYSDGSFNWPIPWYYYATNDIYAIFTIANQSATSDSSGSAFIRKKDIGPFTVHVGDPTSDY